MPYLNVDDELAFHRKAVAAGNAAMGLWVRAGSWSSGQEWPEGQERDGYIPDEIARAIGKTAEINALVRVGFWERADTDDGYQMHDYADHNITIAEARALSAKRAAAGRKGGSRRPGLQAIKGQANG
ncbi:hypothetical protein [uncultured Jatrophihabitans sp.]|uniref:hypothetical protein n=1 Tax=uncultured Jatrophihabitans sp. TaxID=1610747 RepID=UPI0035C9A3D0